MRFEDKLLYNFFYCAVRNFNDIPSIKEPEKCQRLKWFNINDLPSNVFSDVKLIIYDYLKGILFIGIGWG